jgi:uncharacterized protein YcsI (UPF0317 family)
MADQPDRSLRSPRDVRARIRDDELDAPTSGLAAGHLQANLVVVSQSVAFDFLLFCQRNPRPCPILEVLDAGAIEPRRTAPGADLRTDLPRYRVFENGELVDEPTDVRRWWRPDLVAFLLGCSFSFEDAMAAAGLPLRHVEERRTVPMFHTSIACEPAGIFRGPLVVSMRPLTPMQSIRAAEITSRYPLAHGAPVHAGDPAAVGIADVHRPDYGDAVTIRAGEIPVFWACGVTPQAAIAVAKPPLAITHAPGRMFVTDMPADARLLVGGRSCQ